MDGEIFYHFSPTQEVICEYYDGDVDSPNTTNSFSRVSSKIHGLSIVDAKLFWYIRRVIGGGGWNNYMEGRSADDTIVELENIKSIGVTSEEKRQIILQYFPPELVTKAFFYPQNTRYEDLVHSIQE